MGSRSKAIVATPRKRPRGNPNWGKAAGDEPVTPSAFEKLLEKSGLRLEQPCDELAANIEIVKFARKHALNRFVPEGLLKELGLEQFDEER
jgi:hypothetical protein